MSEQSDLCTRALTRQLEGVMFHHSMVEYFEFLTLPGFAELQRYRFDSELSEYKALHKWFIEEFNVLPQTNAETQNVVPKDWYKYNRYDVTIVNRQHGVKDGFAEWIKWEESTRKIFAEIYSKLLGVAGWMPLAIHIAPLVEDVSNEIADAEEIAFLFAGMNYDMPTIISMQNEFYQKYHKKRKHI